jgi:lipopolysaccharide transport system ATP-binding protein
MRARLSFAVSVNINPDILIVDEILSVGDELFRRKSFAKIEEFFKAQKTILFVSHSAGNINELCSRVIMLDKGKIVLQGTPKFVTMNYTKFLFSKPQERNALLEKFNVMREIESAGETVGHGDSLKPERIDFPADAQPPSEKAFLIPNFTPKSTVLTFNAKLKVYDVRMETLTGEKVNALVQHEEYYFTYAIDFLEEIGNVNYGIAFRTEKGLPLTTRIFPEKNKYISRDVLMGESITVKWKFKCLFNPGSYFINTSIRQGKDGNELLLFRGADLFVFRVLGGRLKDKGGFFDAGISLSLEENNEIQAQITGK